MSMRNARDLGEWVRATGDAFPRAWSSRKSPRWMGARISLLSSSPDADLVGERGQALLVTA
jgi:hypothetical protein